MRAAILGYGAIGKYLADKLPAIPGLRLEGVFDPAMTTAPCHVFQSIEELMETRPDIVVECAGHTALRELGPLILRNKCALIIASVGALADPDLHASLNTAAAEGGHLVLPGGAAGGLEPLRVARECGLTSVAYRGRKNPRAWMGTYAQELVDLKTIKSCVTFFEGNAREAALRFPQNANIVAALALSGVGFEKTTVKLMADPNVHQNVHRYRAEGDFGYIESEIASVTLPANPKTSHLAASSLLYTIREYAIR